MAVTCANCGEELLGAVNRCWRCGQFVLSAPGAGEAPPVRQAPPTQGVVYAEVVQATVVVDDAIAGTSDGGPMIAPPSHALLTPPAEPHRELPPRPAVYTQRGIVDIAAIASIVLGAISLLLGVFFSWAVVLGMFGLAAGIWGFRSRWRQIAIIGLLLSLMGMAGSSARLAYDAFTWWYGQSPLGPMTAPDIESQLPDSLE